MDGRDHLKDGEREQGGRKKYWNDISRDLPLDGWYNWKHRKFGLQF